MSTYRNLDELITVYEEIMQQLENDKEYSLHVYEEMRQTFNNCLEKESYSALFALLPYFESPDDYPQFHLSSESRIIFVLLNALKLEIKYGKESFLSSAHSFIELKEQYLLTVFAMRRLELGLSSDDAVEEACKYLRSVPLNVYVAGLIITNEYFENHKRLYKNLYDCMQDFWTPQDKIYWLLCLSEYDSSESTLLELASAHMEINDYHGAYKVLLKIQSPSSETLSIISSLKELF